MTGFSDINASGEFLKSPCLYDVLYNISVTILQSDFSARSLPQVHRWSSSRIWGRRTHGGAVGFYAGLRGRTDSYARNHDLCREFRCSTPACAASLSEEQPAHYPWNRKTIHDGATESPRLCRGSGLENW